MNHTDSVKHFLGRKDILDLLKRRVINLKEGYRQNIALLGNSFVGKSTTLHHFVHNIDTEDVTVIYLDLEKKDFRYFYDKFVGSLLYNFSKNNQLPLHDHVALLIESTEAHIPQTIQVIRKIQDSLMTGKTRECFLGLMALPEVFTNETGKYCVLILDEFQCLEDFPVPQVFQILGKKIMTQKRCFYIVSSSNPTAAKKILSEKLSLLFGNFEIITVEPFSKEESQSLIEHNLNNIEMGFQLKSFLADFAAGHPLYLNLLCQEIKNLVAIHNQKEVYLPLLSQSVENTIFDRWGVISRHFELIMNDLLTGKGNHVNSALLMSLANGHNKIEELEAVTELSIVILRQKINRLLEFGIIFKIANFYCFKDKLFKYWIKYVYQTRLKNIELAPDKQRKKFKEEFHRAFEGFRISSRQDFSSRIIELLECFDNDALDLNGRKYKLPLFRNVAAFKSGSEKGNYYDILQAKTDKDVWMIFLKKDNLAENDFNVMLAESKQFEEKPRRCILISLMSLDENTRIKALQEKFWIWNEAEVNVLLTLFDKPFIGR